MGDFCCLVDDQDRLQSCRATNQVAPVPAQLQNVVGAQDDLASKDSGLHYIKELAKTVLCSHQTCQPSSERSPNDPNPLTEHIKLHE